MTPSIVLGPGDRLRPLGAILGGLGVDLALLQDWADLGPEALRGAPLIVIDAGSIPQEDLGFVRRVLAKNPNAQVIAMGADAGTRVARSLLALPRVRWMGWPPDLEDILSIASSLRDRAQAATSWPHESARPVDASTHRPSDAKLDTAHLDTHDIGVDEVDRDEDGRDEDDVDDEIARIQSILEGNGEEAEEPEPIRSGRGRSGVRVSAPNANADSPFEEDDSSYHEIAPVRAIAPNPADEVIAQRTHDEGAHRASTTSPRATPTGIPHAHESAPSWWRAQVADLADAVQRLELGAQAVRLESLDPDAAEHVDMLDTEVARLVQFTRTLGYVAAPPGRGEQVFDLAEMVQLFVKDLASRSEASPRCLFRAPAHVWVQSDRALLMQVFDALFWLAGACAKGGELVRAQVKRENETAEVRLEFPAGPLEAVELERIVEPYGVRRVLPDLGPNALSAARGILSGQGGRIDLVRPSPGRLEWRIQMPAVEAPPNGSSTPPESTHVGPARRETVQSPRAFEID